MPASDEPKVETGKIFVGRETERDTFKQVLQQIFTAASSSLPAPRGSWLDDEDDEQPANRDLPHIVLISGHGGIGKSRLLERMHYTATRAQDEDLCRTAPIIQLADDNHFTVLRRNSVAPQEVVDFIQSRIEEAGWDDGQGLAEAYAQVSAGGIRDNSGMIAIGQNIGQQLIQNAGVALSVGPQQSDPDEAARAKRLRLDKSIKVLSGYLAKISKDKPLIIFLDTYERIDSVDQQLRPLYLNSGPQVVWVIAGRDSLAEDRPPFLGYRSQRLGGKLHLMPLGELGVDDIVSYFAKLRGSGAKLAQPIAIPEVNREQAQAIYNATRGNALALSMAANLMLAGQPLTSITAAQDSGLLPSLAPRAGMRGEDELVYTMTQRLLLYVTEQDRRHLYALALARRPDPDLLEAMMQTDGRLRELLDELESRYDFVFAAHRTLHDTVAYFLRVKLIEEAQGGSEKRLVADLNARACKYALAAQRHREANLNQSPAYLLVGDEQWRELLLDYLYHLTWQEPEVGSREALVAFCLAVGSEEDAFAARLRDLIVTLRQRYGNAKHALAWTEGAAAGLGYRVAGNEQQLDALLELSGKIKGLRLAWHPDPALALNQVRGGLYRRRGTSRFRAQQLEGAIADFSQAIALDPNDVESYVARGFTYLLAQRFEEAIADSNHVIASNPDNPDYQDMRSIRAAACLQAGQNQQAIADLNSVIESNPEQASVYLLRAFAHERNGDDALAEADRAHARELDPSLSHTYYEFAQVYDEIFNQADQTTIYYSSAIEADPSYTDAYLGRGNAYRARRQYELAIADYTSAIALDPNDEEVYTRRGECYRSLGQYDKAIADFTEAIRLKDNDGWPYACRGAANESLRRYEQALDDYNRAIELYPSYVFAYNGRGNAYYALGEYEQAIEEYNHALKHDPDYPWAYQGRGNAQRALAQYAPAVDDYTRVLALDPKYFDAWCNRGVAYMELKQYREALADFNQVLELDPDYAWAYAERGTVLVLLQLYERARADFDRALELEPDNATAFINRGYAYAGLKQYDDALHIYEQVLGKWPDEVDAVYGIACIHALKHEPSAALTQLKQALELDPTLKKTAQTDTDFSSLLANDPAFAAAFHALVYGDDTVDQTGKDPQDAANTDGV